MGDGKGVEILCYLDIDLKFDVCHVSGGEFSPLSTDGNRPMTGPWACGAAATAPRHSGPVCPRLLHADGLIRKKNETHNLKVI